jgi:hypothetical protein
MVSNIPESHSELVAAKMEGLGALQATMTSPSFAQTAGSSDDLVAAASSTGSPGSLTSKFEQWGEEDTPFKGSPPTTPDTPTPHQRKKEIMDNTENTPTKAVITSADEVIHHRSTSNPSTKRIQDSPIPKYKIALAPSLLATGRRGMTST